MHTQTGGSGEYKPDQKNWVTTHSRGAAAPPASRTHVQSQLTHHTLRSDWTTQRLKALELPMTKQDLQQVQSDRWTHLNSHRQTDQLTVVLIINSNILNESTENPLTDRRPPKLETPGTSSNSITLP